MYQIAPPTLMALTAKPARLASFWAMAIAILLVLLLQTLHQALPPIYPMWTHSLTLIQLIAYSSLQITPEVCKKIWKPHKFCGVSLENFLINPSIRLSIFKPLLRNTIELQLNLAKEMLLLSTWSQLQFCQLFPPNHRLYLPITTIALIRTIAAAMAQIPHLLRPTTAQLCQTQLFYPLRLLVSV